MPTSLPEIHDDLERQGVSDAESRSLDRVDAHGIDRPHAVVFGPSGLFGVACVLELLERGYDVHLPPTLLPPPDLWPDHPQRMHVTPLDTASPVGRRAVLAELTDNRSRLTAAVLTYAPADSDQIACALAGMERGEGGHLLLRDADVEVFGSRSSVTVLRSPGWMSWLPRSWRHRAERRPDGDLSDAVAVAHRAVEALVAGRPTTSYGVRSRVQRRSPSRLRRSPG